MIFLIRTLTNRVQLFSSLLKCEHWDKVQLTDNLSSEVTACTALVNDCEILRAVQCSKVRFLCLPSGISAEEILSLFVLIRARESSLFIRVAPLIFRSDFLLSGTILKR